MVWLQSVKSLSWWKPVIIIKTESSALCHDPASKQHSEPESQYRWLRMLSSLFSDMSAPLLPLEHRSERGLWVTGLITSGQLRAGPYPNSSAHTGLCLERRPLGPALGDLEVEPQVVQPSLVPPWCQGILCWRRASQLWAHERFFTENPEFASRCCSSRTVLTLAHAG